MTTREIITLQLGHYANYVGAHWWNLQEANFSYDPANPSEVNNDVLYREGESPRREVTFTPRLLVVDLKGSLGYLAERGSLYDPVPDPDAGPSDVWDPENLDITTEDPLPKSSFIQSLEKTRETGEDQSLDLESEINSWVDYLVPRFHPRTVNIVREYQHKGSNPPFDVFHYGRNLWCTEQFQDDFSDRIRAYAEECDLMQGFQVLLDSSNAFGGLATSCIEHLRDEYNKSILAFPLIESQSSKPSASDQLKAVNLALCYQQLNEHSSLFSPLCCGESGWLTPGPPRAFPNLIYNPELRYHSSAILATALDTLTIRYRHKQHSMSSLSDLCADLNKLGRKAAATSLSLPFPMATKRDLIDVLDDLEGPLWTSLTPRVSVSGDRCMQSVTLRGISEERLKRPLAEAKKQMGKAAYRCSTVHEMMSMYLAYSCHASATHLTTLKAGLKVSGPFPKVFGGNVHGNGDVAGWPVGEEVKSVPVLSGIHSTPELSKLFESLHDSLSSIKNIKRFHALEDSGLEQDDFTECLSHLLDSKENYEDHYV
ncbi:protein misato [Diachasma alloeum]|uniref:protein misato n=1 Tax=Diachasma alloeum TaxID=454923 RepID=UPI0007381720|nr:protein misato [Diachasma alloeum]